MVSILGMDISQWLIAHSLEIAGYLLAIILIPRILLERHHPGATIAWVLAIGFVPYLGVPLYFLIGGRRIKKISLNKDWGRWDEKLDPDFTLLDGLPADNRKIAHLLVRAGIFPPDWNSAITIIDDGINAYKALVNLLEDAQHSIEIVTFILARDEEGRAPGGSFTAGRAWLPEGPGPFRSASPGCRRPCGHFSALAPAPPALVCQS